MRYADFRDQFENALQEAGLFVRGVDRRIETIDLADSVRHWKVDIWRANTRSVEPFHVSAVIAFTWDPINTAARKRRTDRVASMNSKVHWNSTKPLLRCGGFDQ